mgnify:CR=1 FL=1
MSQAGRTTTARTGRIVGSPIISSPMNSASQPLRVTATRTPTRLAASATVLRDLRDEGVDEQPERDSREHRREDPPAAEAAAARDDHREQA